MNFKTIDIAALDREMRNGSSEGFEQWNALLSQMEAGDEIVAYSDIEVHRGFCSGDEGIALLRAGNVVTKIVRAIIA